jgi:hypothetical protein
MKVEKLGAASLPSALVSMRANGLGLVRNFQDVK